MKVGVEMFNMVKRSSNLDLQLARTAVLKLGQFFAIFVFPAYCKAPEPSTNTPGRRPQKVTDAWAGSNPPADKHNCGYIIYKFFPCVACSFEKSKELCVIALSLVSNTFGFVFLDKVR